MEYHFEDFTENSYRNNLHLVKANWEIISFDDYRKSGRVCLWRHDVDFSVHRAYKLALVENDENIRATYFIHLHSNFYNALEDEVVAKIFDILSLDHRLGLHFDPHFSGLPSGDLSNMRSQLKYEQSILETTFQTRITSFSLHNPREQDFANIHQEEIAGMVNAYSAYIRDTFSYCSDSNGYWRFRNLKTLLLEAADEKIHILTHPEMWTPEPMSPRERVTRCIEGRAARQHKWYDNALEKMGRKNIR